MDTVEIVKTGAPFVLAIVGPLIGYKISLSVEKRKNKREIHLALLRSLNEFLYQLNSLITEINNIDKFGRVLLEDRYQNLSILVKPDYNFICLRIESLRSYLKQDPVHQPIERDSRRDRYYVQIMKSCEVVLNPEQFIDIASRFERESVNYYYLMDKKLRSDYQRAVSSLAEATRNNMIDFDIEKYKNELVDYVRKVNLVIDKTIRFDVEKS